MSERVGTVKNRRRDRAEPLERAPTREEVADERLAARNQLVGEHVPRPRLESARAEQFAERWDALRPYRE